MPSGALPIARGPKAELEAILPRARLSYDGETYLVPGVPEAPNQTAAYEALRDWGRWAVPARNNRNRIGS